LTISTQPGGRQEELQPGAILQTAAGQRSISEVHCSSHQDRQRDDATATATPRSCIKAHSQQLISCTAIFAVIIHLTYGTSQPQQPAEPPPAQQQQQRVVAAIARPASIRPLISPTCSRRADSQISVRSRRDSLRSRTTAVWVGWRRSLASAPEFATVSGVCCTMCTTVVNCSQN